MSEISFGSQSNDDSENAEFNSERKQKLTGTANRRSEHRDKLETRVCKSEAVKTDEEE
jgi:hypothetical protein